MSQELFRTPKERAEFEQNKAEARNAVRVMLVNYQEAVDGGTPEDEAMVATSSILRMFTEETSGDLHHYLAMAVRIMHEKGVSI